MAKKIYKVRVAAGARFDNGVYLDGHFIARFDYENNCVIYGKDVSMTYGGFVGFLFCGTHAHPEMGASFRVKMKEIRVMPESDGRVLSIRMVPTKPTWWERLWAR